MALVTQPLTTGWAWKQRDKSLLSVLNELSSTPADWITVDTFPSEIHVELMKAGKIPDPFKGFNEHRVQWVGKEDWLYKCDFSVDPQYLENGLQSDITFDGLDTFCDVYLNGEEILKADNQFRTYNVQLRFSLLSSTNVLLLHFKSAQCIAKDLEARYGVVRAGSCNLGDPSRVYVRKAQYDWRWDWGPELMTVGPYRPVTLHLYTARLVEVFTRANVSETLNPSLSVDLTISGSVSPKRVVQVCLKDAGGNVIRQERLVVLASKGVQLKDVVEWDLANNGIKLWWPTGNHEQGEPNLYLIQISLLDEDDEIIDTSRIQIGFRRAELIQQPLNDAEGTSFLFRINNTNIFIGGSNWIPADSFLTTVTPQRYRAWLQLLKDGNQNMIRVWGGGTYESDCFYDICDKLGILVWQDFQFSCGIYPAHDAFLSSVTAEAESNIVRLRHHPSLVLWCGNNEDYQQILQWGEEKLPAIVIYEDILPKTVNRLTEPQIPYHRGSPYGGKGWDTSDPTVGDVHQWNVWAGREDFYQNWDLLGGRFVSEFGMPAIPDLRTVKFWMDGDETQMYSQSRLMQQHNKAGSHERRLAIHMNENFRICSEFESYVYLTQLLQSEAVSSAYRVWKRQWKGLGKEYNSGVLVWQLNDCWPVTSWAIVDYFLRPKMAYYSISRELSKYTVGLQRKVTKNRTNDRPRAFYEFGSFRSVSATIEVWATNMTLVPKPVRLEMTCFDLLSDWKRVETKSLTLMENASTEILEVDCPEPSSSDLTPSSSSVVVSVRLLDPTSGVVLARFSDWPQPYKFVHLPDPGLQVRVHGETLTIQVKQPIKGLLFSLEGSEDEAIWSDNGIDVVPGDEQQLTCRGLDGRVIYAAYLGREKRELLEL